VDGVRAGIQATVYQKTYTKNDSVSSIHTADNEHLTESNPVVAKHLTPDCSRGNEPAFSVSCFGLYKSTSNS